MSVNSYFLSPELTLPSPFSINVRQPVALFWSIFIPSTVLVQLIYSKNVHRLRHDCLE